MAEQPTDMGDAQRPDNSERDRKRRGCLPLFLLTVIVLVIMMLLLGYCSNSLKSAGGSESLVKVPDVVGLSQPEATSRLESAGFRVDARQRSFDTTQNVGKVVNQLPLGGDSLGRGATVSITVAEAVGSPRQVGFDSSAISPSVPDVVSRPRSAAVDILTAAGYVVNAVITPSSTIPSGQVISQNPVAGTILDPGSTVTIVVSSGPPALSRVRVPSVIGLNQSQAEAKIKSVGLHPWRVYGSNPKGNKGSTYNQWPLAGTLVDSGTQVEYQIGI